MESGASWRELVSGYGPAPVRRAHREAVVRLHAAWRATRPSWYPDADSWLELAACGPQAIALLVEAERAGVVLQREDGGDVRLAAGPAALVAGSCSRPWSRATAGATAGAAAA